MFKKSKRSFQQRTRHSDSDDDNSAVQDEIITNNDSLSTGNTIGFDSLYNDDSSNSLKTSNKNERKTKLSFEEEEEEGICFRIFKLK